MKVIINQSWSFEDAVKASYEAYIGSGITSKGYRNSVLMSWANAVGKERALGDFNRLITEFGSKKALAEGMDINPSTLRKIERFFLALPALSIAALPQFEEPMVLHQTIQHDEDREHEFKEISLSNRDPVKSIASIADEYAVAFLNSRGGRILWGITDKTHAVVGVKLNLTQRDELRRRLFDKFANVRPAVDLTAFSVNFHPVLDGPASIEDCFVVRVDVPKGTLGRLYFTGSNGTFVRVDGVKQRLSGPAIQEWIERRPRSS